MLTLQVVAAPPVVYLPISDLLHPPHSADCCCCCRNKAVQLLRYRKVSMEGSGALVETGLFNYNKSRAEGGTEQGAFIKQHAPAPEKRSHQRSYNSTTSCSSTAYLQVLGTGMDTHDTLPSILLFFDKFRIIFNAGEGLQRFCTEYKIKLSKVDYVCLTRVCSETVGGLPGLLLTLAGIEKGPTVKLWGPADLRLLVAAMKSFVPHVAIKPEFLESDQVSIANLSDEPISVCQNRDVKISAIFIKSNHVGVSTLKPCDVTLVYICELAEIKGRFHKHRAEALGVKPGPKYGQLQNKKSVKSDTLDLMVHPADVMDPSIPGPIVLIVDCPTKAHAEKLFVLNSLSKYSDCSAESTSANRVVNCIVHLTPGSIVQTTNYQNWMKKFSAAEHVMAGHNSKNLGVPILQSSARISHRLNYLCPELFPALTLSSHLHHNDDEVASVTSVKEQIEGHCHSVLAENLLKFTLLPLAQHGLDKSLVPCVIAPSQAIADLLLIPELTEAAKHIGQFWHEPKKVKGPHTEDSDSFAEGALQNKIPLPSCLENIRRDDAEIVLLGTGSSQPSKYRNVSSIFVNLFSKGCLLLDCGEGTLAQLRKRYGLDGAASAIKNLRCIWISHIHADHHTGLVRILALRRDLLEGIPHAMLHVVGPGKLKPFLDSYGKLEYLDMQFIDCKSTTSASWDAFEGCTVLQKCQSFSSDPMTTKHDNETEDTELTTFVNESCLASCSKRQKICIDADNHVDFSYLRSLNDVLKEAGLESLTSFPVVHCPESFGIILKGKERINKAGILIPGWKVVYSGDTRPCMEVVQASHGATLLIHEATFEDDLVDEAVARNHSTTEEAIKVGDAAGVYRIVLTHFSQRYPKIPFINEKNWHNACIAFDLMSINMADLPVLPRVLPHLKSRFMFDVAGIKE